MSHLTNMSHLHYTITSPIRGSKDGVVCEQRDNSNYFSPYKFSAKEKNEVTNYSYFGAIMSCPKIS